MRVDKSLRAGLLTHPAVFKGLQACCCKSHASVLIAAFKPFVVI
jgi:hypothetical protein